MRCAVGQGAGEDDVTEQEGESMQRATLKQMWGDDFSHIVDGTTGDDEHYQSVMTSDSREDLQVERLKLWESLAFVQWRRVNRWPGQTIAVFYARCDGAFGGRVCRSCLAHGARDLGRIRGQDGLRKAFCSGIP